MVAGSHFATSGSNALAIRAYVATGNTSSSKYLLVLNKLKELQATDGSWDESVPATSRAIWSLIETGENPDSLIIMSAVSWLKRQQNADGGWGRVKATQSYTNTTSLAIIALVKAEEPKDSPIVLNGVNWLKVNQNSDGFWGMTPGGTSTMNGDTFYAVIALSLAESPSSSEVQNAVNWLSSNFYLSQYAPWGHTFALHAFTAANSLSNAQTALDYVLSDQRSDGGWNHAFDLPSRHLETARAIAALVKAGYAWECNR